MHSSGACLASESKLDDSSDGPAFKVCLALPGQLFLYAIFLQQLALPSAADINRSPS